jgi:hypothetical protein
MSRTMAIRMRRVDDWCYFCRGRVLRSDRVWSFTAAACRLDSVTACAAATETGSAALYATVDDDDVLITSSNGVPVMSSKKSIRNVSRMPKHPRLENIPLVVIMSYRIRSWISFQSKARETDWIIPARYSLRSKIDKATN